MADEEKGTSDPRLKVIKDRVISAYPKLAGPKLDKSWISEEVR